MGLDQYAYAAAREKQRHDFYYDVPGVSKPIDIAYWRKHPNLQGWMERLWLKKQGISIHPDVQFIEGKQPPTDFNGVELELTWQDLEQLEHDILNEQVSKLNTQGFFFGNHSDEYYRDHDLQFIRDAKAQLFLGLRVFYNSSW